MPVPLRLVTVNSLVGALPSKLIRLVVHHRTTMAWRERESGQSCYSNCLEDAIILPRHRTRPIWSTAPPRTVTSNRQPSVMEIPMVILIDSPQSRQVETTGHCDRHRISRARCHVILGQYIRLNSRQKALKQSADGPSNYWSASNVTQSGMNRAQLATVESF